MFRTTLIAAALAGSAYAQVQSPLTIVQGFLPLLSQDCRNTITTLVNSSSPQYQCLRVDALLPALLTNGSIIPPVNNYLTQVCSSAPCNASVVNQTASAIATGCGADLQQFGINASYVSEIVGYYDLARSVACLKNENKEVLANATIPLNSTLFNFTGFVNSTRPANITLPANSTQSNSTGNGTTNGSLTNGTFCLTEFATNITGYLGVNLTNAYIDTAALGGNYSAIQALGAIPRSALCSDCLFAAVNLINEEIPAFGDIVVYSTGNATNNTIPATITINSYLDQVCTAKGYNATGNGTLPEGIYDAAVNSTLFPTNATSYTNVTLSNTTSPVHSNVSSSAAPSAASSFVASALGTSAPSASASAGQLAGRMAEKRRWIGEQ